MFKQKQKKNKKKWNKKKTRKKELRQKLRTVALVINREPLNFYILFYFNIKTLVFSVHLVIV